MTWVRLICISLAFTCLTSCDYNNERTFKRLIWDAIQTHMHLPHKLSIVKISIIDDWGNDIGAYNENISETEYAFLRNTAVFDSLSKAADDYNRYFARNTEPLKSSFMHFSSAILAIEDFLNLHQSKTFEEISYVYYVYGAALESAKLCYTTYESYKFHSKLTDESGKKSLDLKIANVQRMIKNSGNELGHYIEMAESSD